MSEAPPKRVLIIATSHEELGDTGEKTGLWMEEVRRRGAAGARRGGQR